MTNAPTTSEFLAFACKLADVAGDVIRPYFRANIEVENKHVSGFDPVTKADQEAEAAMRALITQTYPAHGILGEEHGLQAADGAPYTWVLDPIDGTRSFISGFPTWGTLIALNDGDRPLIGVLDQPFMKERYTGSPEGAFLGERKLVVRPCANLADAVLYSTTPDMFTEPGDMAAFNRVETAVKLRRFGGDCYSYAMLAMGQIDLIIEASMQPYDIQALIPIVEGAGGIVSNWEGDPADDGGRIIAAGDRRIYDAALVLLANG